MNTNIASLFWQRRLDPGVGPFCELHVSALDLLAREAFFEMKVKADQGEDDGDRFGGFVGVLSGVGVDYELVDKCGIGMRKRVIGELVVEFFVSEHTGGFEDGISDLIWSTYIGANGNVRGAVEWQAALIAHGKVGVIGEDGAGVFGSAAAGECCVQFDFKMNEQGAWVAEKKRARVFAFDGATAESEDEVFAGCEARDGGVFAIAKISFSVVREDVRDGRAGFFFDHVIDINELPAETGSDERTDSGLARAHEACENDTARRRYFISR